MRIKSHRLFPTFLAVLLFFVITVVMTWPLARHINNMIVGWVGDNYLYVWMIGWFQKAWLQLHQSPLFVPFLNYPEGYQLAHTDVPFTMILPGLPFSVSGAPALGYNISIFVSFILSGLGVYLWVRRLTDNIAASIIAGMIFAFAPYRMSHLYGHLNLMGTQWLPFYFWGLSGLLKAEKQSWKCVALACVSLGLIGLTSQYYLYMALILSIVYILSHILFNSETIYRTAFWKQLTVFGVIAALVVVLCVLPYVKLAGQDNLVHTFEEVRVWSASPTDFILPSPRHFIWGEWIDSHFDRRLWIENTIYLGVVPIIFSLLALIFGVKALPQDRPVIRSLALTAGIAFVLALGTDLHWLGQAVQVAVPQLIQRWYPHPQTSIPLPGYFLFRYAPYYAGMRVWMRFGIFVMLFVSVLASIGIAWLLNKVKPRYRWLLSILIFLLVFLDFFAGAQPLSEVKNRPVDVWLSAQSPGAVAQFPFWQNKLPRLAYDTLMLNKPIIGEPFLAFDTPQFKRIQPVLKYFPNPESVDLLRELGVRWVVVSSADYQDFAALRAEIERQGLIFKTEIDGQFIYELE